MVDFDQFGRIAGAPIANAVTTATPGASDMMSNFFGGIGADKLKNIQELMPFLSQAFLGFGGALDPEGLGGRFQQNFTPINQGVAQHLLAKKQAPQADAMNQLRLKYLQSAINANNAKVQASDLNKNTQVRPTAPLASDVKKVY